MDQTRTGALHLAINHGVQLVQAYGGLLVQEYRAGKTLRELAERYSPDWTQSRTVAKTAVKQALERMLVEEEREKLCKEHRSANIKRRNEERPFEEEKRRIRSLGLVSYKEEAKETDLGTKNEQDYYVALVAEQSKMNEQSGRKRIDWHAIAERTNKIFGNQRTGRKIANHYYNKVLKVN